MDGGEGEVMTVPVWVEQQNGKYTATVLGAPQVRAEAATREQVVTLVTAQLRTAIEHGQVVLVDPGFVGISGIAGKFKDDPTLHEICEEAYRLRDAERDTEHADADRP
jgi:hypothetical protein